MRSRFRAFNAIFFILASSGIAFANSSFSAADGAKVEPAPKASSAKDQRPSVHTSNTTRSTLKRPSDPRLVLDENDELAALHAIQIALQAVGDGDAYIWHRGHGLLGGMIRPTTSFKGPDGTICRHIIIRFNSGRYSREAEGIACRDTSGRWSLSG